jgi:hypothetical protein
VVEVADPAVGPEPASREASSFVTFSISAVHCPASAIPMGKAITQTPNIHSIAFMALFSRLRLRKAARRANSGVSISIDETSRRSVSPSEWPLEERLTSGIGMEETRVVRPFRTERGLTLPLPEWFREFFRPILKGQRPAQSQV